MEGIKIAIVEDETPDKELLLSCVERFFHASGIPFTCDYYRSVDSYPLDVAYQLVFIDIIIFEKNGFELSKRIRERYDEGNTLIVFVTSLLNYAVEGYAVGASGYIVKPYQYEDFALKMAPTLGRLKAINDESIMLYTRQKERVPMPLRDIYYVVSSGHYMTYHTRAGEYEVRQALRECLDALQEKGFYQINGYCVASLANIGAVKGDDIEIDGQIFPLSRSRKKGFLLEFARRYGI